MFLRSMSRAHQDCSGSRGQQHAYIPLPLTTGEWTYNAMYSLALFQSIRWERVHTASDHHLEHRNRLERALNSRCAVIEVLQYIRREVPTIRASQQHHPEPPWVWLERPSRQSQGHQKVFQTPKSIPINLDTPIPGWPPWHPHLFILYITSQ